MKSAILFPITSRAKILVEVGQMVASQTSLAEGLKPQEEEVLPVADALEVAPAKITKYLKKKIGQKVVAGEVLAEKKRLFSTLAFKSPKTGTIKEIDLREGTLTLVTDLEKAKKIFTPIKGKINHITERGIGLEVEAPVFATVKGAGKEVIGKLKYLEHERLGILDVPLEVDGYIIACREVESLVLPKLEVLGCFGIVLTKLVSNKTDLSWVVISEETFKKLADFEGKEIWLRPQEHQIVFLD